MREIQDYFWRNNGMLVHNQTLVCKSTPGCAGWPLKRGRLAFMEDEDDDITSCENCRWDHELQFFYGIFRIPYIG
jgi:Zn-finger protein